MILQRAVRKAGRVVQNAMWRRRDARCSTYSPAASVPQGGLTRRLQRLPAEALKSVPSSHLELCELYLMHRFDLLGSGWVCVRHGMNCSGLEGWRYEMGSAVEADAEGYWLESRIDPSNRNESRRIWKMVDRGYIPIDWHLDFKSGYRWREDDWYRDVRFGHMEGVDVKVPWELARMQHLPQLAVAYAMTLAGHDRSKDPSLYAREFRNEVLDFAATNPPRYGVNWSCAMDVAIRAVNWLVAYDLFCAHGYELDDGFRAVFERSVYEHGIHIINNLEWTSPAQRNNHYLADIAGLLIISSYLPETEQTAQWLQFAASELVSEVKYQFNPDGTNKEGSTFYHVLSAEMVAYAFAMLLGVLSDRKRTLNVKKEDISYCYEMLEKMGDFVVAITKPNGSLPQIGDNDSGRFLKLMPDYKLISVKEARRRYKNLESYADMKDDEKYFDEERVSGRSLVAAINGLVERNDLYGYAGAERLEKRIAVMFAGGKAS